MPIQTSCPQCQSSYRLPDTQLGKRVRCKKCQSVFIAGEVTDAPVLQEASREEASAKRPSKLDKVVEELPVFDEVTTSAPRSHHAPPPRRAFEDDRPRRDDYDDRDRLEEEVSRGGGNLPLILGGVGAAILLAGLGLIGAWYMMQSPTGPDQAGGQTEQTNPWQNDKDKPRPRPGIGSPAKPQDVDTALAYLKIDDNNHRRMALEYLASATVD